MTVGERFDEPASKATRGGWPLAAVLALAFVTRAAGLGQPIVENYVGRQIPTAMVARNLQRGSGFLRPQLDVAPLPNLFLVEPPIYASLAGVLSRFGTVPLDAAGRLTSDVGILLAAWGLFGLVAMREGRSAGLIASAVLVMFPVTIRYGRAFQPDALMLGCLVAGLRCWDAHESGPTFSRLLVAYVLLATALALKVVAAFILVPLVLVVVRRRDYRALGIVAATLIPAALWYAHAAGLIGSGEGSRASADNGAVWLGVLVPSAWLRVETYRNVARFFGVRAFTPLGPVLALAGFWVWPRNGDRLWRVWGASGFAALASLAAKLHHEYYWLAVAPVLAVGVARALTSLHNSGARGRFAAWMVAAGFVGLAGFLSVSTWKTPAEWASLRAAAREVKAVVPAGDWVVAPEALLFEADRRGCRLELTEAASRRAAGEWGEKLSEGGPAGLVEFYRQRGARYFADVVPKSVGPDRAALHRAVRRRYNVSVDNNGVLIARLTHLVPLPHGESPTENAPAWLQGPKTR